jgi:hypothetical protein
MYPTNKFSSQIHFILPHITVPHSSIFASSRVAPATVIKLHVKQHEKMKEKNSSQGAKAITLFFMDILPPHNFYKPPSPFTRRGKRAARTATYKIINF